MAEISKLSEKELSMVRAALRVAWQSHKRSAGKSGTDLIRTAYEQGASEFQALLQKLEIGR